MKKLAYILPIVAFLVAAGGCKTNRYAVQQVSPHSVRINTADATFHADSSIIRLITPYKVRLDSQMNVIIGVAAIDLPNTRPNGLLGNYIADVMRFSASKQLGVDIDIAFTNISGIRMPSLQKGEISRGEVFEMLPFDNMVVVVEVKGETLKKMLEKIADKGGEAVSGVKMVIKDKKLESATYKDAPIVYNRNYIICTNDFLFTGGDGYTMFKDGVVKQYPLSIPIRTMVMEYTDNYCRTSGPLNPQPDERITVNRKEFLKNMLGAGMAIALTKFPLPAIAKSEGLDTITILHTNDWHSRIEPFPMDGGKYQGLGGAAYRAALIKQIRSETENVLLLDSGDMWQGTPYFNFYGGELEYKLMSEMGYDCATLGNHDFDGGLENLKKQLPHAKFNIINSNYSFDNTILEDAFKPYRIYDMGKVRVGITAVGIDLQGLVPETLWKGVVYTNPVERANFWADFLKKTEKCDVVILLSHLGFKYGDDKVSDEFLAKNSRNIDIILGGHTHTFLDAPVTVTNLDGKTVTINQVGWAGIMLGRLDITMISGEMAKSPQSSMYKVSRKSM